jgi:hypothetical protein
MAAPMPCAAPVTTTAFDTATPSLNGLMVWLD